MDICFALLMPFRSRDFMGSRKQAIGSCNQEIAQRSCVVGQVLTFPTSAYHMFHGQFFEGTLLSFKYDASYDWLLILAYRCGCLTKE